MLGWLAWHSLFLCCPGPQAEHTLPLGSLGCRWSPVPVAHSSPWSCQARRPMTSRFNRIRAKSPDPWPRHTRQVAAAPSPPPAGLDWICGRKGMAAHSTGGAATSSTPCSPAAAGRHCPSAAGRGPAAPRKGGGCSAAAPGCSHRLWRGSLPYSAEQRHSWEGTWARAAGRRHRGWPRPLLSWGFLTPLTSAKPCVDAPILPLQLCLIQSARGLN